MRALVLVALLATAASAQTMPGIQLDDDRHACDPGDPTPTPFPAETSPASIDIVSSGPEPVAMPTLCDAPVAVALRAGTGPASVRIWEGPAPMSDLDRLRERYGAFRAPLAPGLLQRLDPAAPGADRYLRDVEPFELGDRWVPYPDIHAPQTPLLGLDQYPEGAPALPPVALPAGRE